jgi:hypothetical protein
MQPSSIHQKPLGFNGFMDLMRFDEFNGIDF